MQELGTAPAAFLSAKGRVLCDAIVVAVASEEFMLDCHNAVSKSLLRFLLRHKLREPIHIQDVSSSHAAVALLPAAALEAASSSAGDAEAEVPSHFYPDPRFAALGHRALLETEAADKLLATGGSELSAYHLWRLCCGVPEGPIDLKVDAALPLHGNLDLLNFISFNKGCYIGQELTHRTYHVGAVRRRFFSVVSAQGDPQSFVDALGLDPAAPLPPAALLGASGSELPSFASSELATENEVARAVESRTDVAGQWKSIGLLHSASRNIGLCMLRSSQGLNKAENFKESPLAAGTQLAVGGVPLALRPPPYAFVAA